MATSSTNTPSLGVVAICRDEEQDLPGFLSNLMPWADDIVLVDDGSSDNTLAIARAAGPKVRVFEQQRCDDSGFAGQRNRGIEESHCDWLLHMDIDERVPAALKQEIRSTIATTNANALRYRRLNFFLHRRMRGGGWDSWNQPQLAKRGQHRFTGKVHEQCQVEGNIGQLQHFMWHLNDANYSERMRKSNQYCQLRAEQLIIDGRTCGPAQLVLRPIAIFLRQYLLQRGLRDGVPGLIAALHTSSAEFKTWALVWDVQNSIKRSDIEKTLERD